ncbi:MULTISPECIES: DUF2267 domain-containing protein [unclassified Maridesulfovibrio]|uniref:DUF2267 domain-containing protein n=1 Tax=unclassified Maridesulfovibrio TaxID=2794999 RepID=UPI003B407923
MTFTDFLGGVKTKAGLQTRHMAYTMTQGVFQVFRRRLTLHDAIRFSNMPPSEGRLHQVHPRMTFLQFHLHIPRKKA